MKIDFSANTGNVQNIINTMGNNLVQLFPNKANISGGSGASENSYCDVNLESIEDLNKAKKEKEANVKSAETKVSEVEKAEAKNIEQAEKNYDQAVKKDNEVSNKLKEDEAKISGKISKHETTISENKQKLVQIQSQITSIDSNISNLKAQIGVMQSSLEQCQVSAKNTDSQKDSSVDFQIAQYKTKIEFAQKEIDSLENKKEKLQADETIASDSISNSTMSLNLLKTDKALIGRQIRESCSENTKQLQVKLNEVKSTAETNRKNADTALEKAKSELAEIEEQINNHSDLPVTYKLPKTGDAVAALASNFLDSGDGTYKSIPATAIQNMFKDKYRFDEDAWCGDFAAFLQASIYGKDGCPGNYMNSCNYAGVGNINDWAQEKGIYATDTKDVKPGDLIVYGRSHVGTVVKVNDDGTVDTVEGNTSNDTEGSDYYSSTSTPDGNPGWCAYHHNVSGQYVLLSKLNKNKK